jgi:AcrR family transcriptional regulator
MEEPHLSRLMNRWREVFRAARALWGTAVNRRETALNGARAHVLLENTFWLPVWISRYDLDQYSRVEARLMEVLAGGIAAAGERWAPGAIDLDGGDGEKGRAAFLGAATRLINELGYRGASVQRIASQLNVTKGSFYHHLDAKDDLVIACYRRSFDAITTAQARADAAGGSHWQRLASVVAALIDRQFGDQAPLMRTTALQGLPPHARHAMVDRSNRIARRFAGTIMDGVAEGSCRPGDALIAAQLLMALQNAAFDMRRWAAPLPREEAIRLYASTVLFGLFQAVD